MFADLKFNQLWLIFIFCLPATTHAIDAAEEYEIKAVYFLNVSNFVYWTKSDLQNNHSFQVCILGHDPFGQNLDFVVSEVETIQRLPIKLTRITDINDSEHCHSIFISDSEQLRLPHIFKKLSGKPILTISDMDRFVIEGGMVQFYRRGSKIRLMLDPEPFFDADLKPSSHLMRIAKMAKQ